MKKIFSILLLAFTFSFPGYANFNKDNLVIKGKIESYNKKIVVVKTKKGSVKIPRHFFNEKQLKKKNVAVRTTLSAILKNN